ncbi:MAG: tetraacyldisaccharide 4'-kinase [Bacteroidales bacterium]|nr:tetraacyldisaccharide 4'-kinase [Bacteroidales bacterium]
MHPLRYLLAPLSWPYWAVVKLRNLAYSCGLLRSHVPPLRTICVGNLTVGGTGKTPHTEYLLRLLSLHMPVAVLSRGYRRQSKGFVEVQDSSTALQVGDEPLQMKRKFPHVTVAVDADRVAGVAALRQAHPELQLVLLDDAFQHRRISPGLSVLLADYRRPMHRDLLLPAGSLRDSFAERSRAHIVVVTKCPPALGPADMARIERQLRLHESQQLYFTRMAYGPLRPLLGGEAQPMPSRAAALCGIARPEPFLEHLQAHTQLVAKAVFPDHHHFAKREIMSIFERLSRLGLADVPLITTEKDAVRLAHLGLPCNVEQLIMYQEISVEFVGNQAKQFNEAIMRYAREV